MEKHTAEFEFRAHPDHPGWNSWKLPDETRFNAAVMGELLVRTEGEKCRVRMFPSRKHTNPMDSIHGGATLAFIDISLFAAMQALTDNRAGKAVTLELSTQFIDAGKAGEPLDCVVEVLRETGRLLFLRGTVAQGDRTIAGFSGLVRK